VEGVDHLRAELAERIAVRRGQALDEFVALRSEVKEDLAAVIRGHFADYRGAGDELIDDADGAVVPDLQLLREIANRELSVAIAGAGADCQKSLILVWSKVFGAEEVFAEA